ncbi:MAG: methyl-accepting chemotaxis protein [Humidesulfovibrio sp.]|nr:methyl-accepting chemotaxis protein [Humidesulfovibrio sp.]
MAALLLGALAFAIALAGERKTRQAVADVLRLFPGPAKAGGGDALVWLETAVLAASRELKHQTGLAQGILGGLPVPFLLVDEKERAVSSNQECLDMLEIDGRPQDYYGKTLAEIFYNDPGRKTAVGKSINNGEVFRNLEVEIKGHKGGVRHVLANVFPLYDSDKRCLGGLCLYLDMTALKQKEQLIIHKNESIGSTAADANSLCQRLRAASARLSANIGQTSQGSEAQKVRVGEIGVSMEQMGLAVVDVAKNAALASQGADDACQRADEGARVVSEVISAIQSVAERSLAMQQRLTELDSQVAGIGQILGVINDIADQTNLLALNAAIEAARAGDAGRGFAVVADEVRKLAEKTMQATQQVATATQSVQQGAQRASEGMAGAAEAVGRSTELADSAGQTLQDILHISQGSADRVRNIATASEEQSASADEISRSVDQVREVSERTAGEMAAASQAVEDLTRLADELTNIIANMQTC